MTVTVIPAQPGFYIANLVQGDNPPTAVLDPIIAWVIHTVDGVYVTPVTFEDGEIECASVAVVRPDLSVVQQDTTYSSVAEWLLKGVA